MPAEKIELSDKQKQLLQIYARMGVPMDDVAALLGISERTIWRRISEDEELQALYKIAVYQANTQVAGWLFESCKPIKKKQAVLDDKGFPKQKSDGTTEQEEVIVKSGNTTAQIFWLKTRGKWSEKYLNIYDSNIEIEFDLGNDLIPKDDI